MFVRTFVEALDIGFVLKVWDYVGTMYTYPGAACKTLARKLWVGLWNSYCVRFGDQVLLAFNLLSIYTQCDFGASLIPVFETKLFAAPLKPKRLQCT